MKTCDGKSCNDLVGSPGVTCSLLEKDRGCDCSGCSNCAAPAQGIMMRIGYFFLFLLFFVNNFLFQMLVVGTNQSAHSVQTIAPQKVATAPRVTFGKKTTDSNAML